METTNQKGSGKKSKKDKPGKKAEKAMENRAEDGTRKQYEELSKELKKMEEDRLKLEEENKKLEAEIMALKKELKREDRITREVEKKVEEEAEALGNLQTMRDEVQSIKENVERTQEKLDDLGKWKDEVSAKLTALEDSAKHVEHVPTLISQMDELGKHISKKAEVERIQKIEKGIKDIFEDIEELGEEIGYGETMNISKIPSQVLEAAYQTILDDVVKELKKSFGAHEAEKIIVGVTDDLRQRTSGSELFRVRGSNIELEDVVMSIEKGLISNKQVQMTYEELVKKLAEHVPHYRPKNLRAMMRIKSLEFAVEKLRILIAEHEYVKKELGKLLKNQNTPGMKNTKTQKYDVPDAIAEETSGGEESA